MPVFLYKIFFLTFSKNEIGDLCISSLAAYLPCPMTAKFDYLDLTDECIAYFDHHLLLRKRTSLFIASPL